MTTPLDPRRDEAARLAAMPPDEALAKLAPFMPLHPQTCSCSLCEPFVVDRPLPDDVRCDGCGQYGLHICDADKVNPRYMDDGVHASSRREASIAWWLFVAACVVAFGAGAWMVVKAIVEAHRG